MLKEVETIVFINPIIIVLQVSMSQIVHFSHSPGRRCYCITILTLMIGDIEMGSIEN